MNLIAVDDEALALGYIVKILKELHPKSKVTGFDDPSDALDYAKNNPIDIAFLDIEMYGMTGIELAKAFKDAAPSINIIFVTGFPNYALDAFAVHAKGYLLKPPTKEAIAAEISNLNLPKAKGTAKVRVQTFGNFDIFVDDVALTFARAKSKELLAYLIDRKGSSATTGQLISVLWEDRDPTLSLQKQFQSAVSTLIKVLKTAGIEDILIKKRNYYAIDPKKFDCDYYNFLNGDIQAINLYSGEYMITYSWAEFTTGLLSQKAEMH